MLIGLGPKIKRRIPPVATAAYMYGRNYSSSLGIGSDDAALITSDWITHDWGQPIQSMVCGHHCYGVILEDQTLYTWGATSPSGGSNVPQQVPGTWKQVALGLGFGLSIDLNDDLYVWGSNADYGTGLNTNVGTTTTPTQIMVGTKVIHIACLAYGSFAITSTNDLFSWGNNVGGGLGQGVATGYTTVPTQVGTLKWKDVTGGRDNALGITTDGTIYGWGEDRSDANGHTLRQLTPLAISGLPLMDRLAYRNQEVSSLTPSAAFDTSGNLWVWGNNAYGQIFGPTISIKAKTNMGTGWKDFRVSSIVSMGLDHQDRLWHIGYSHSDGVTNYFPLTAAPNASAVQEQYQGYVDQPISKFAVSGSRIFLVPA